MRAIRLLSFLYEIYFYGELNHNNTSANNAQNIKCNFSEHFKYILNVCLLFFKRQSAQKITATVDAFYL